MQGGCYVFADAIIETHERDSLSCFAFTRDDFLTAWHSSSFPVQDTKVSVPERLADQKSCELDFPLTGVAITESCVVIPDQRGGLPGSQAQRR